MHFDGPASWSVLVADADTGERLVAHGPDRSLRTASVGKLLLLVAAAHRMEAGMLDPAERLHRDPALAVADSGVWRHLTVDSLPVADVARLVGLASDNWATNVLLHRVGGPDAVATTAERFGLYGLALHDRVRDERTAAHPETLSSGSARACVDLFARLHDGSLGTRAVAGRVAAWLRGGLDLSMVAAAFGLDPLAHGEVPDRGLAVLGKTGTDAGVRADAGIVTGPARSVVYACVANWSPAGEDDPVRDDVLATMRTLGDRIRALVTG